MPQTPHGCSADPKEGNTPPLLKSHVVFISVNKKPYFLPPPPSKTAHLAENTGRWSEKGQLPIISPPIAPQTERKIEKAENTEFLSKNNTFWQK